MLQKVIFKNLEIENRQLMKAFEFTRWKLDYKSMCFLSLKNWHWKKVEGNQQVPSSSAKNTIVND